MPQTIPEGFHTLNPYLAVDDAATAIDFYKRALDAKELSRIPGPNGMIAHASLQIGDSIAMLSDPFPQGITKTPKEVGATTVSLLVYVDDVDAVFKQAIGAGATSTMEPENQFWGDRWGSITDPFGHSWQIATHIEDVTPEEMAERSKEWMAQMASG